jgi:hypothetical protein
LLIRAKPEKRIVMSSQLNLEDPNGFAGAVVRPDGCRRGKLHRGTAGRIRFLICHSYQAISGRINLISNLLAR